MTVKSVGRIENLIKKVLNVNAGESFFTRGRVFIMNPFNLNTAAV